jgi:hypothetical protein
MVLLHRNGCCSALTLAHPKLCCCTSSAVMASLHCSRWQLPHTLTHTHHITPAHATLCHSAAGCLRHNASTPCRSTRLCRAMPLHIEDHAVSAAATKLQGSATSPSITAPITPGGPHPLPLGRLLLLALTLLAAPAKPPTPAAAAAALAAWILCTSSCVSTSACGCPCCSRSTSQEPKRRRLRTHSRKTESSWRSVPTYKHST